ncbi:hypothetical protein UFOVP625_26 [uncultured Caudovirales phage]|uniref:Uncharacterized protein n=1 Tax=uncultured Caudovirales phage TaxID=2100421 RepID=A0A6J5N4S7_9CAUD|nr:hypothetical protein UFOVP625_26 [uncultured Caudovirales phage]
MAVIVLKDAFVSVGGVDVSTRTNSVTLNYEIDSVETTSFGDTGHKFIGGLQNVSCEVSLQQDYAAANVEATLYPLVGTTTTVIVKPVNTTTSATNPAYTLTGTYLAAHTPVAGAVGELAMTSVTFTGGTISKATS